MAKIFELVVGYPPFDNFMPNKDDLIREWVLMFGDLPDEWREGLPSPRATGKYISISLFYNSLAIGLLWSYQRKPTFLSNLHFKTRYLILTYRGL